MSAIPYAILQDGQCIDRVMWDGGAQWAPPPGTVAVPDEEGVYSPQPPVLAAPTEVTRSQGRMWIFARGLAESPPRWTTFAEMDAAFAAMIAAAPMTAVEREIAGDRYREASTFHRHDSLLLALLASFGITDEADIDQAFREAAAP